MRVRVGDRISFYHGLGASRLAEGVVRGIETQVGIAPDVGLLEPSWVNEVETESRHQGAFIDLADGRWTYASHVVEILPSE